MGNKYGDIRWKWLAERGFNVLADKHQYAYMQSLWSPVDIVQSVFVNAKAGTGKTSLAIAAGIYAIENEEYDKLIYIRNALPVREQGFLKGDLTQKEEVYFLPLLDALYELSPDGYAKWRETDEDHRKIHAITTSYLRGINFKNAFVVIDEAQNLTLTELQTVLTRIHDTCKVVVIGSTRQVDNDKLNRYGGLTPFEVYMEHFKGHLSVQHKLENNYRGKFANHADDIMDTVKLLNSK